ncbi:tripartite tricarboxylate transporter substrate binding protein [Polaromonas jejuensis]|uniref:Tripartite tricarboxylate transporter substrate binding protein n=1 Tax=Polaromonas jejuensis TaxID=457502 RepID=A0ABW0QDM7_9BURK|nr:tripartite tricarboxylate transporter substrate binding protein [Polaromonas jejuensis]
MKATPKNRRHALNLLMAGLVAGLVGRASPVRAQDTYPKQPIRFLVPYTAGSATDITARALSEQLSKALKQPIVIDNKPGAGGTLGAYQVASAKADGYTVLIHSASHVANAALYPGLKYDTLKDFTPITMLATLPNVLVTGTGRDFHTVQELVQKAKAAPGTYTYASAGNGSATHLNAEKFRASVGINAIHVPFKGTPEALTEVMAGRIDWFFAPLVSALPLIKSGRLVALAVGTPKRSPVLPSVPTTLEAGFTGSDYTFWVGMFVPAKTPADVVERIHAETIKALKSDVVRERLETLGAEVAPMPQAQFASLVNAETSDSAALIKKIGMKVD